MATGMELPRVSDENYGEILAAPAAVVLFKIANCAKCDEFEPVVTEVSSRYEGKVRFGKALLHVPGACREIKRQHRFETFPTTHFYRDGKLVHQAGEKLNADALEAVILQYLL
jgi:thioredoxin-like negative regulator of GroEL